MVTKIWKSMELLLRIKQKINVYGMCVCVCQQNLQCFKAVVQKYDDKSNKNLIGLDIKGTHPSIEIEPFAGRWRKAVEVGAQCWTGFDQMPERHSPEKCAELIQLIITFKKQIRP